MASILENIPQAAHEYGLYSFDSVQDGSVAVFTPHTGFKDPTTPDEALPRRSIEVRTLVFYD